MSLTSNVGSQANVLTRSGNETLNGTLTIANQVAASIPLTVTGVLGQLANLIEAKNSTGTVVWSVDNAGDVFLLGDEYVTDALTVTGNATVAGTTTLTGLVTANGGIIVTGNSSFSDTTTIHSLTVQGDLTLETGYIRSKYSAGLHLLPAPSTITKIGAGTPSSLGTPTNNDAYIAGRLEVCGNLYTSANIIASGAITLLDNNAVTLGTSSDALIEWDTIQTNDALMITTGTSSEAIIMCQKLDRNFNFAHAVQTNPTLFIHSANQATTQWISMAHNQADGVLEAGLGNLKALSNLAADKRLLQKQSADVASANDITLVDGNYIDITGATEVQRILGTGWIAGSIVVLQFDSNPQVTHNTAAGGGYFGIQLAGAGNFSATAGDTLTLVFDGAWWRECARTAI